MCCQDLATTVHVKLSIAGFYWHNSHNVLCVCVCVCACVRARACARVRARTSFIASDQCGFASVAFYVYLLIQPKQSKPLYNAAGCRRSRKGGLKLCSSFYYKKFVSYNLLAILIKTQNSKYFLLHLKKL
jgi:hypothetical protein